MTNMTASPSPDLAERMEEIAEKAKEADAPEEMAALMVDLVEAMETKPSSEVILGIAQVQMLTAVLREVAALRATAEALWSTA